MKTGPQAGFFLPAVPGFSRQFPVCLCQICAEAAARRPQWRSDETAGLHSDVIARALHAAGTTLA
jgi:hypothetical protein